MIPVRTPFFLPLLFPTLTWRIPVSDNSLFLTFDDGPINGPTDFVLETLAVAGAEATFFCIGDNIRKHPLVFDRLTASRHSVGNHTFNHLDCWKTPRDIYLKNVAKCQEEMSARTTAGETRKKLFRPPYGKITPAAIRSLQAYQIVMWDVLTKDFDAGISSDSCLRNSIASTRKGSVIVFHDSIKAEKNLTYVLPRFIDHFREKGYQFKVIPQ